MLAQCSQQSVQAILLEALSGEHAINKDRSTQVLPLLVALHLLELQLDYLAVAIFIKRPKAIILQVAC